MSIFEVEIVFNDLTTEIVHNVDDITLKDNVLHLWGGGYYTYKHLASYPLVNIRRYRKIVE